MTVPCHHLPCHQDVKNDSFQAAKEARQLIKKSNDRERDKELY